MRLLRSDQLLDDRRQVAICKGTRYYILYYFINFQIGTITDLLDTSN